MSSLAADLEEDLKWREGELASLKVFVATAKRGSTAEQAGLRALWTMLYAHYEGYTLFCWNRTLDEIEQNGVLLDEVSLPLLILALEDDLRALVGNASRGELIMYFQSEFKRHLSSEISFGDKITSERNIWPDVFVDNCAKIGVACKSIEDHRAEIRSLVARRNDIAHGKKMTVRDLDEYQKYENAAMMVMCELAVVCLEFIEAERYRSGTNLCSVADCS